MGEFSLFHWIIVIAVTVAQVWPLWIIGRKLGKAPAASLLSIVPLGLIVVLIYYAMGDERPVEPITTS